LNRIQTCNLIDYKSKHNLKINKFKKKEFNYRTKKCNPNKRIKKDKHVADLKKKREYIII